MEELVQCLDGCDSDEAAFEIMMLWLSCYNGIKRCSYAAADDSAAAHDSDTMDDCGFNSTAATDSDSARDSGYYSETMKSSDLAAVSCSMDPASD